MPSEKRPQSDSKGRPRLPPSRYAGRPTGGVTRYFLWRCKDRQCERYYAARSRAKRFDTICTGCGTRNTIRWDSRRSAWWDDKRGRPRVTRHWFYDTLEAAQREAVNMHQKRAYRVLPPWRNMQFMTAQERLDAIEAWNTRTLDEK